MPSLWRESRQLGPDQLRFTGRCHTRGCKGDAKLGSDDEFVSSDEERTALLQKAGISSTIAIGAAEVLVIKAGLVIPWNKLRLLRRYTYNRQNHSSNHNSLPFSGGSNLQAFHWLVRRENETNF